jgi:SAM-dependent methyltransferase
MLFHVAREILANVAMGVPTVTWLRSKLGQRTTFFSLSDRTEQMRRQFAFFMGALGDVRGKTIAELGPGDTVALGALLLKAGAARYIAYDRFAGNVFGPDAVQLYEALGAPLKERDVSIRGGIEDVNISTEPKVDIFISCDVLEHVKDPLLALRNMAAMLTPDGVMVHRIDYSAHDVWRSYDNPFTFLMFPRSLWNAMTSNRGCPNRVRHVELTNELRRLGLHVDDRVTHRFDPEALKRSRDSLPLYKAYSDDDMLVMVAEFTASPSKLVPLGAPFD